MDDCRDEVMYRFELPDETKLTWGFQLGSVIPKEGEPVIIPGLPGVFEVAGYRWRLPNPDIIPREPVVGVIVVRECGAEFCRGLSGDDENDPFDGDPDGGDPRDRR